MAKEQERFLKDRDAIGENERGNVYNRKPRNEKMQRESLIR